MRTNALVALGVRGRLPQPYELTPGVADCLGDLGCLRYASDFAARHLGASAIASTRPHAIVPDHPLCGRSGEQLLDSLKIAQACGVEPGWLLFGDRVQFPVIGQAHDEEAWQPIDSDRIGRVAFELGSAAIDMVVIEVLGDGNAPAYRDRDMLFCARHAGRNFRNIVGRDCVVRTRGGEHLIKQALERQTPRTFTLRSVSNPVAKGLKNVAIEWAAPIVWIRRSGR